MFQGWNTNFRTESQYILPALPGLTGLKFFPTLQQKLLDNGKNRE